MTVHRGAYTARVAARTAPLYRIPAPRLPQSEPPMPKGTLLYAQSGGVTAVINATASAVIAEARARKVRVLAARNGILGALREELVDTTKESAATVRALAHTPGGAFGSDRKSTRLNSSH